MWWQPQSWRINDKCVMQHANEMLSLWVSGHRLGLVSSSSPKSSSYCDGTCLAVDRFLHICAKTSIVFHRLRMPISRTRPHADTPSLTDQSGSCAPRRCPRSSAPLLGAPPCDRRKPMSTGCGPSPPPLRNPPSWTDSSCSHWAAARTHSKDQLLRHCPELSHLASPDRGFDKCVCVVHARACVYRVAGLKAVGGAVGVHAGRIWFWQADALRVWVPVVTQMFLHTHKHTTALSFHTIQYIKTTIDSYIKHLKRTFHSFRYRMCFCINQAVYLPIINCFYFVTYRRSSCFNWFSRGILFAFVVVVYHFQQMLFNKLTKVNWSYLEVHRKSLDMHFKCTN